MKHAIIQWLRLLCTLPLPGRYVWTEWIIKAIGATDLKIAGRVGTYSYPFDFKDLLQRQMYFGLYDIQEIDALKRIVKPGSIVLDIGANVGFYSLTFSEAVGQAGLVYAFEPMPHNCQKIETAIAQNHITNIHLHPVAVGNASGQLTLYVSPSNEGNTGAASVVVGTLDRTIPVEVEVVVLDDLLAAAGVARIDFIKIDIEGFELEALQGLEKYLTPPNAPVILYESNAPLLLRRNQEVTAVAALLKSYGYQNWYALSGSKWTVVGDETPSGAVVNYIASKSELEAL